MKRCLGCPSNKKLLVKVIFKYHVNELHSFCFLKGKINPLNLLLKVNPQLKVVSHCVAYSV